MQDENIEKTLTLSAPIEFIRTKKLNASAATLEAIRKAWRPKSGPAKILKTTEPEDLLSADEAAKVKMAKLRAEWRPVGGPLAR